MILTDFMLDGTALSKKTIITYLTILNVLVLHLRNYHFVYSSSGSSSLQFQLSLARLPLVASVLPP